MARAMSSPPPLPQAVEYEARTSALDKTTLYRLGTSSLEIVNEYGTQSHALADISEVRCRFFPTRVQRDRYETLIKLKTGQTLKITNQFYRGMADFDDRSDSYKIFLTSLHEKLGRQNTHCAFYAGTTALSFWLNAVFLGTVLLILLVLGIIMITAIPAVALVKFALILFYLPTCWRWFKRNKPQSYQATAIPPSVLP